MRRIVLLTALAAAAFAASPVALAHGVSNTRATVEACHTGLAATDRWATFGGEMAAVPGTQRMQMRFDLYTSRRRRGGYRHVSAPGLGVWQSTTDTGVGLFHYHQQVAALGAPASYRALVHYRWLDGGGHVLRTARRMTSACREPDLRPDLVPEHLRVTPAATDPSQAVYRVWVRNRGASPAGPFAVDLAVAGTDRGEQSLAGLSAGGATPVSWTAPRCSPGDRVTVAVDPNGQVAEAREGNDTLTVDCPLSSS